jgi:hypothetical protein
VGEVTANRKQPEEGDHREHSSREERRLCAKVVPQQADDDAVAQVSATFGRVLRKWREARQSNGRQLTAAALTATPQLTN